MPEIQLKHIVSCSSEDRNNPADNLLKAEGTHKWRTAAPGEKNATVVIQFEKASQITGIDIGNEGSAFVEVLVGKSTSSDYQVLLVSSSFMTPADSRSGSNRNSVRMFSLDKLSKTAASENWDRVKLVCTQPFNKSTTYGLSFIKLHTGSDSSKTSPKEGVKKLGAFVIKNDDDDDVDDIKVGSLFANKGKMETIPTPTPTLRPSFTSPPTLTGAAAVRAASRQVEEARLSSPASSSSSSNARPSTSRTPSQNAERDPAAKVKLKAPNSGSRSSGAGDEGDYTDEEPPAPKTSLKRQSTSMSSTSSRASDPPPLKRTRTEPPKKSAQKEFSRLMSNVTFVLSGFQNPYRAELREKALEMGATYKPDWGRGCTHLICAFTNTPKYNQVKGRGRIVSKQWITDCHRQKKLLPWRKYRLGDAESPGDSSEEEEEITPGRKNTTTTTTTPNRPPPSSSKGNTKDTPKQTKTKAPDDSDDNQYGGDTDSADDTDEEIRRATSKAKATPKKPAAEPKVKPQVKVTKPDPALEIFADSTDEDDDGETNNNTRVGGGSDDGDDGSLPDLPDFFADKHFFFYGDFPAAEKRVLTRYIAAHDGVLEDYMTDRVKYVITSAAWDDNFDQAVSEHPGLVFIRPQWIHSCHDKAALLSYKPFAVHR